MDGVGRRLFDPPGNLAGTAQRNPQAGIGRQLQGEKAFRRQKLDGDVERMGRLRKRSQGTHHPIDLGDARHPSL